MSEKKWSMEEGGRPGLKQAMLLLMPEKERLKFLESETPIESQPFGVMPDGTEVKQYTLRNEKLSCDILTYGAAIRSLRVPDRDGNLVDVVLGFDTLEDYLAQTKYMGAMIGRCANRIGGASFTLNGKEYRLAANNNQVNHLHGGVRGFDKQVWEVLTVDPQSIVLTLSSPDGQEGYPGKLEVILNYRLEEDRLHIGCFAFTTDGATLCNLTNHSYFNLSGHDSGPVLDQFIQLYADAYTPTDKLSIPTGEIASVEGTPMDLREPTAIGAHIDEDFPQLVLAGGYDHNWVLREPETYSKDCDESGASHMGRPAASAYSPDTGIMMGVFTTQPGVQFYTGNHLEGCPAGKGGAPYGPRWGFCLETQRFPDGPHHASFPSSVLEFGELYRESTVFWFSVKE